MGTYTKSTVGRTARPRSERLRRLGGIVGVASSVSEYGRPVDGSAPDWFQPDSSGDNAVLRLNPKYAGLRIDGFATVGGVNSDEDTPGTVQYLDDLEDVEISNEQDGDMLVYDESAGKWVNLPAVPGGSDVSWGTPGADYVPLSVDGVLKNLLTQHQSLAAYVTSEALRIALSVYTPTADLAAVALSGAYNSLSGRPTIPAYALGTLLAASAVKGMMLGVNGISNDLSSSGSEKSLIKWEPNAGGAGVGAWRFFGNVQIDGWASIAGVGSGSGSGGGSSVEYLDDILDVSAPNPSDKSILAYDSQLGAWTDYLLHTINGTSLIGSGNLVIRDGVDGKSAYEIWLDEGNQGTEAEFLASLQGNSGYQGAAGELQVVNNLTDGGATEALSAEMGKLIAGILYPLVQRIASHPSDIDQLLTVGGILDLIAKGSKSYFQTAKDYYANMNGLSVGSPFSLTPSYAVNYTYEDIAVKPGDIIVLTTYSNTTNAKAYAIMDADDKVLEIVQAAQADAVLTMPSGAARFVANTSTAGTHSMFHVMGRMDDLEATEMLARETDKTISGYSTAFITNGQRQALSPIIRSGDTILSITGTTWNSVNIYDANGQNSQQITPAMLPYKATRDYYYASTYIDGNPTLTINIGGVSTFVDALVSAIYGKITSNPTTLDEILTVAGVFNVIARCSKSYFASAKNYYANMNGLSVGDTFTLTPASATGYTYEDIAVVPGDIFAISTVDNTTNAKAYAIMDEDDEVLAIVQNAVTGLILTMPAGAARLVVNTRVTDGCELTHIMGKTSDYDAMGEKLDDTAAALKGYSASFRPTGQPQDLSPFIKEGDVILSVTGATWTSVNLYDENGENRLNITPAMLPYTAGRDYYKASTYIDGTPTLTINVGGIESLVDMALSVVVDEGKIEAKQYGIGNHDNDFHFDKAFVGELTTPLLSMQPNFNLPTDGVYLSTDVERVGYRSNPTDDDTARAYVPYLYADGKKIGTIVLFDDNGYPYIYDRNGNKRLLQLQ